MSHNVHTPHLRRVRPLKLAVIAVSALAFVLSAASAHADAVRCKREIAKASAKYAQARMRSLQKCQDGKLTGKVSGTCPDAKTSEALSKAAGKLRSAIDKEVWRRRQGLHQRGRQRFAGLDLVAERVSELRGRHLQQLDQQLRRRQQPPLVRRRRGGGSGIALYYGSLVNSSNTTIKKCQREIGKNAVKYLRMKSKLLQKCKDKVLSGQSAGPCPDPKTATVLGMAEAKRNAKICSACGGDDRVCGGSDDLAPRRSASRRTAPT
mgnify:CR=1 FL=1